MYPRIDAEVSKRRNHLLKSPFVIHPGTGEHMASSLLAVMHLLSSSLTGRVCVPVEVSKIDEFEPSAVPTVGQLLRELDRPAGNTGTGTVKAEDGEGGAQKIEPGETSEALTGLRVALPVLIQKTGDLLRLRADKSQTIC